MERCWINRHRADRIVRAVVAAGFIDRQKLDQLETNPARPIDELPQPIDIANAEIVFRPQREERRQDSRDAFYPATNSFVSHRLTQIKHGFRKRIA